MTDSRRGGVIIAVLLLLAIGVVIAAGVLVSADAAATMSRAEMSRTQSRALAWSGLQAVMAEISSQREQVLDGAAPELTAEWSLFTRDDGARAVVRLLDLAPDDPAVVVPENAKLDLNSAPVEVLAKAPGLSAELAAAIVSARAAQPFGSAEQLLSIEGITPEMLYGRAPDDGASPPPAGLGAQAAEIHGLSEFVTVFSFDPNVQLGLDGDDDSRGEPRICLNQPWSDELRSALAERLGEAFAAEIAVLRESGRSFAGAGDIASAVAAAGRAPEDWAGYLDALTASRDPFIPGRLDVNHAPRELLACIPGITPEQAGRIADARDAIDPASRRSPVWPVVEGILAPDDYFAAAPYLTARSAQWRVRIEVGMEEGGPDGGPGGVASAAGEFGAGEAAAAREPELRHRLVYEAVIDIASRRPRIAYLRDVTSLEPMLAMLSAHAEIEDGGELAEPELPLAAPSRDEAASGDAEEDGPPTDVEPDGEAPAGESGAPAGGGEPEAAPDQRGRSTGPAGGGDRRIGRWNTRRKSKP